MNSPTHTYAYTYVQTHSHITHRTITIKVLFIIKGSRIVQYENDGQECAKPHSPMLEGKHKGRERNREEDIDGLLFIL